MFLSISTEYSAVFNQFELLSLASLREIIVKIRLSSGGMDIVPPCLLKDLVETIVPKILAIINCSLASGDVPKSFKHAVVKPVIKKCNLGSSVFANFRPISKLTFLPKLLEKIVFGQLY